MISLLKSTPLRHLCSHLRPTFNCLQCGIFMSCIVQVLHQVLHNLLLKLTASVSESSVPSD